MPDLDLEGLGDIAFYTNWRPWGGSHSESSGDTLWSKKGLSLVAGVEFPTGEDEDSPMPGVVPPSLLQLGSGTYDPNLGLRYQGARRAWRVFHQSTAQLPIGESDAGLKPGESLEVITGVGYQLFDRFIPNVSLDAVVRWKDELNDISIRNTGGYMLFVTPGISIHAWDQLYVQGTARIPIYRDFNRTQLSPGTRWQLGVSWSF